MSTTSGFVETQTGDQVQYVAHERDVEHPRLTLRPDGTLEVVARGDTPIHSLVTSNIEWITDEYEKQLKQLSEISSKYGDLTNGLTIWGSSYILKEADGAYTISIDGDTIIVRTPVGRDCYPYLANQLRSGLKSAIQSIIGDFCNILDVSYKSLTIRKQHTKWASCSTESNLSFNFRCAFLPTIHLHYLIAHEVVHLDHYEHSRKFWETVELLAPKYEALRAQLQGFWYSLHRNSHWCNILSM